MTVRAARELIEYWADYPPPHIIARLAAGIPMPERRGEVVKPKDLAAQFGGKFVKVASHG